MEDKPSPIVQDVHLEYGSIGFGDDQKNWEWKTDESLEYHPEQFYDGDGGGKML